MRRLKKEKIKIKPILLKTLNIFLLMCVFFNIIFLLNTTLGKKEYLEIFEVSFFKMNNDLMEHDINKNDLVLVKKVNEKELQEGDIIAYKVNGNIRINKIIDKQEDYTTKSNKNFQPDIEKVNGEQIIGKKIANIRFLGLLLQILQSKITSVIILIFLILKFGYNKYMYITKKERSDQIRQQEKIKI